MWAPSSCCEAHALAAILTWRRIWPNGTKARREIEQQTKSGATKQTSLDSVGIRVVSRKIACPLKAKISSIARIS